MSAPRNALLHKLFITSALCILLHSSSSARADEEKATSKPEKHYLRTGIIEALAIGAGTAWYWIDRERQVADWDFPTWRERLTVDVMRYGNNPFHVNFAWHAGNGAGFHTIARVNGLSLLESIGAGALTSLTWEYALEYREKVSVNDLIFTTGAGIPLGEFVFAMGRYFNEDPEASQWKVARWTLGFPAALTRALDGVEPGDSESARELWHRMHLSYAMLPSFATRDAQSTQHTLHSLHLDGRFVRLPGYRETGVWSRFFRAANLSHASMDIAGASEGSAMQIFAETTLLGTYQQQFHPGRDFLSNATVFGVSMAYRYRREKLGAWDDRVGVLHMPGLAGDAHLSWRDLSLDASVRVHPDFVGINALSNDEWNAANPDASGKTILRKMGYYYGFGASAALAAELRYRNATLGGSLWLARYESDEGLDRTQEDLSFDQESSDELLDARFHFRLEDLPYRGFVGLSFEYRARHAELEEFEASTRLKRFGLEVGMAL